MNNDDRVFLARLEEKMKSMHEDVTDIKNNISRIKGCVAEHGKSIAVTQTKLNGHLSSHETSRKWVMWIPSVIALVIAVIAVLK